MVADNSSTTNQAGQTRDEKGRITGGRPPVGFHTNPENRSDGRWDKNNCYSYWLNFFMKLTLDEFKTYDPKKRKDMTMAMCGAWARISKSYQLEEFREVADRTEGKPKQTTDITSKGDKLIMTNDQLDRIIKGTDQG
jgi:hypothetical protein